MTTIFPQGFKSLAKNSGIKEGKLDSALVVSDCEANCAAVFTQSLFAGAPIIVGKEKVSNGKLQAFLVTSGNSNVATGERGISNSLKLCEVVGGELGISADLVLHSSTGVIGRQLPMEKIEKSLSGVRSELRDGALVECAKAIMTTDTKPKYASVKVGEATLFGMVKGVGMIEPNMATMLGFFLTDAKIESSELKRILKKTVDKSFNMVSVDTDTSTSDTVLILANGLAGEVDILEFEKAFKEMSITLAKEIVRDGEGATKLIEVNIAEAFDFDQAKEIGKSIVNSPLVKTAIHGCDPNWGRICMAIGKCSDQRGVDPRKIKISFGELKVFDGAPVEDSNLLEDLESYLSKKEIEINVSLGAGDAVATVWGCDLTEEYIRINADYTT